MPDDKKSPDAPGTAPTEDRALILGRIDGTKSLAVVRRRSPEAALEAGILAPLQEGKPIVGEVVRLHPCEGSPLCKVEVALPASRALSHQPAAADAPSLEGVRTGKGPAKVNSETYRGNWDEIFGAPRDARWN